LCVQQGESFHYYATVCTRSVRFSSVQFLVGNCILWQMAVSQVLFLLALLANKIFTTFTISCSALTLLIVVSSDKFITFFMALL